MLKAPTLNNMQTSQSSYLSWLLCFFATLLFPAEIMANSTDSDQPMNIEANKVILKEKNGISRYLGNVAITQGSRKISGDNITIFSDENNVTKVIIEGKPASFSQLDDNNEKIEASSHKMIFYAKTDILVLETDAVLQQKDNIFRSDKITYNTAKDIITAGKKDGTDSERVKITILPQKDNDSPQ